MDAEFNDSAVLLEIRNVEKEELLISIHNALEKYKIEYQESERIKKILASYFKRRKDFEIFSQKARCIWNNEVDPNEFKEFKESLERNLTNRTLYDKQLLAAFHLAFAKNACNFSVPGAGKTSVVYGAYAYLSNLPEDHPDFVNRLLIIGPLSSFGPWENEYEECFGKKVSSKRLSGGVSPEERNDFLFSIEPPEQTAELSLMSYQSVQYNLKGLQFFLKKPSNHVMIVLDEAHKIKSTNPDSTWAPAVLSLSKLPSVKSKVVLTGTPVPNGYEDIYNLYEFIWPNKNIINFNVFQLQDMSNNRFDDRVDELVESISPFFIRIKKNDLGLPPIVNHDPIKVKMSKVQREIYDFLEDRYISYFEDNQDALSATTNLKKARFVRLMQCATNPDLLRQSLEDYYQEQGLSNNLYLDDNHVLDKILNYHSHETIPAKFETIKSLVSDLVSDGQKVILWGTFILSIKQLQQYLNSSGIDSRLLIGEVPVERDDMPEEIVTREKIIREFHEEDCPFRVIIANPFAVAESISLHHACHHAVYFERTFNASNFIQSKDRIHRVGLEKNQLTHYHYILSEDSIDETIHRRLMDKERRMLELIESQEIPLISENLSRDIDLDNDIRAIIRDYVRRSSKA
nr:DEAD/DEAH box helicase [Robiginitalea sp. SC105]